ncbi:MAG: DUF1573 domain-containing protein, partial [Bacteroidia bacterium]
MIKHLFLISFSLLFIVQSSLAQVKKADIVFDKTFHNFGTIFMENGVVTANYNFTNKGLENFIVSSVEAACGCTNPRSSKDTIGPGESGVISVEFDPKGMVGTAKKWVYVHSKFVDGFQIELNFEATIKSTNNRNAGEYYRGEYGYLLVDRTDLLWGDKFQNDVFQDSLVLTNDGYDDIVIKKLRDNPVFIASPNLPLTIKAGESKPMYLDIDLRKIDTVGQYYENLKLITTDRFFKIKSINYGINFKDDFSTWKRRDLKNAAHISLSNEVLDFGQMASGGIKQKPVTISNTGKSTLIIKRIESDCSCALLRLNNKRIEPGKSITVQVKFDALFKEGAQTKIITLYTNDPNRPIQN